MRMVLPYLIAEDQTGFLASRNITTNLRKTLDVVVYCKKSNKPAVILTVDMNKCFDRVAHSAITGTLRYFNFDENFIQWSSLFFMGIDICTQNYGYTSQYFTKQKSINQGCCYSPSIYLLIGEIIANKLRNNNRIDGIQIGNCKLLLSQFADDMDLYLPFNETILNEVITVLTCMEAHLGVRVSYDKTSIYHISSIANTSAKLYTIKPIRWTNDSINTLGVDIHNNRGLLNENFNSVINKMRAIAEIWYYRNMMLTGKILVINTLLASLFVYRMQLVSISKAQKME